MADATEKILEIKVKYDDAIRKIAAYQTEIDKLKNEEKKFSDELKKRLKEENLSASEREAAMTRYNAEMAKYKAERQQYADAIRILNKEIKNERIQQTELEGSAKALRAELSNLTAEYDSLSRAERQSAKGTELQDKINAITDELKGAEEETQRFYRNVGNYEESIKRAVGINNDFANSLINISQNSDGFKGFMSNAKAEISSFTSSLTGLLKNKVFLGVAGIAGAGYAFNGGMTITKGLRRLQS